MYFLSESDLHSTLCRIIFLCKVKCHQTVFSSKYLSVESVYDTTDLLGYISVYILTDGLELICYIQSIIVSICIRITFNIVFEVIRNNDIRIYDFILFYGLAGLDGIFVFHTSWHQIEIRFM